MDTTSAGIKALLDSSAKLINEARKKDGKEALSFHAGECMKLAAGRFAADCAELKDEPRKQFILQWMATPGWFACGNNSACQQAYNRKGSVAEIEKTYAGA